MYFFPSDSSFASPISWRSRSSQPWGHEPLGDTLSVPARRQPRRPPPLPRSPVAGAGRCFRTAGADSSAERGRLGRPLPSPPLPCASRRRPNPGKSSHYPGVNKGQQGGGRREMQQEVRVAAMPGSEKARATPLPSKTLSLA